MIVLLDSENADRDLTSQVTVLTHTPSATLWKLCQALVMLGDGTKNLDGTGGDFELEISVGGNTIQPGPQVVTVGASDTRMAFQSAAFLVPPNAEVLVKVLSPNAADTDVDVTAYLVDVAGISATGGVVEANAVQIEGGDATDALAAAVAAYGAAVPGDLSGLSTLDAVGVRTAVGLASANLDTQLAAIVEDTGEIGVAGVGLSNLGDTRIANLDATVSSRLADADYTAPDSAATIASAVAALAELQAARAFARGKFVIDTTARTVVFYAADDATPLFTWSLSADYKTRTVT